MKKATQKDIVSVWVASMTYAQMANDKKLGAETRNECYEAANKLMAERTQMMKDYCKRTGKSYLDLHKKLANEVFLATKN